MLPCEVLRAHCCCFSLLLTACNLGLISYAGEHNFCTQGSGVGVVSTQAAPARVRRGWVSWVRRWVGGGAPDAVLAAFPLARALTSSAAAALPGMGQKYAALLESGACDERTLLMLLLVRLIVSSVQPAPD